jgi:hypothetical protein
MPDTSLPMEVHSELSDVDDGRVAVNQQGACVLDAYPSDPITCTVKEITPVAREKGGQSLRRAFDLKLALATTDAARMHPGMSVKIVLSRELAKGVLLVPRGAELAKDVKLGSCDAQRCEVLSGLHEGDKVIVGGGE